jgi:hypothetical protein
LHSSFTGFKSSQRAKIAAPPIALDGIDVLSHDSSSESKPTQPLGFINN